MPVNIQEVLKYMRSPEYKEIVKTSFRRLEEERADRDQKLRTELLDSGSSLHLPYDI